MFVACRGWDRRAVWAVAIIEFTVGAHEAAATTPCGLGLFANHAYRGEPHAGCQRCATVAGNACTCGVASSSNSRELFTDSGCSIPYSTPPADPATPSPEGNRRSGAVAAPTLRKPNPSVARRKRADNCPPCNDNGDAVSTCRCSCLKKVDGKSAEVEIRSLQGDSWDYYYKIYHSNAMHEKCRAACDEVKCYDEKPRCDDIGGNNEECHIVGKAGHNYRLFDVPAKSCFCLCDEDSKGQERASHCATKETKSSTTQPVTLTATPLPLSTPSPAPTRAAIRTTASSTASSTPNPPPGSNPSAPSTAPTSSAVPPSAPPRAPCPPTGKFSQNPAGYI